MVNIPWIQHKHDFLHKYVRKKQKKRVTHISHTHMLNVWPMYLHLGSFGGVGKCTIHCASGIYIHRLRRCEQVIQVAHHLASSVKICPFQGPKQLHRRDGSFPINLRNQFGRWFSFPFYQQTQIVTHPLILRLNMRQLIVAEPNHGVVFYFDFNPFLEPINCFVWSQNLLDVFSMSCLWRTQETRLLV